MDFNYFSPLLGIKVDNSRLDQIDYTFIVRVILISLLKGQQRQIISFSLQLGRVDSGCGQYGSDSGS